MKSGVLVAHSEIIIICFLRDLEFVSTFEIGNRLSTTTTIGTLANPIHDN
jgi:hypothetical protein